MLDWFDVVSGKHWVLPGYSVPGVDEVVDVSCEWLLRWKGSEIGSRKDKGRYKGIASVTNEQMRSSLR